MGRSAITKTVCVAVIIATAVAQHITAQEEKHIPQFKGCLEHRTDTSDDVQLRCSSAWWLVLPHSPRFQAVFQEHAEAANHHEDGRPLGRWMPMAAHARRFCISYVGMGVASDTASGPVTRNPENLTKMQINRLTNQNTQVNKQNTNQQPTSKHTTTTHKYNKSTAKQTHKCHTSIAKICKSACKICKPHQQTTNNTHKQ